MAAFHYVHFRAFAHETEDRDRVRAALRKAAQVEDLPLTETEVEGSHKNRILILEGEVKRTAAVRGLFRQLAQHDPRGFRRVVDELDRRLDEEQNLFFRLDKQEAYLGRLALATGDDAITVRAKIRSFQSKRSGNQQDEARAIVTSFLAQLDEQAGSSLGQ